MEITHIWGLELEWIHAHNWDRSRSSGETDHVLFKKTWRFYQAVALIMAISVHSRLDSSKTFNDAQFGIID